ncbi:MAG TPA: hydrogenase formation protein HypD [Polyangiaceae bacterium]|nr:hydrogenase formation protein HypD [Polyangiaceae bacterium]
MKFIDEYRDGGAVEKLVHAIEREATRPHVIMEVCGGQTHSIVRYGIDELLPPNVELVHGPGCPVCVTSLETIDRAHAIASEPGVIFCSFGDMLRVPGSSGDLFDRRSAGADVRVVYSPLDALKIAVENPTREVVFFAIGFETTAPASALSIALARRQKLGNFSALVSHVRVPPAMTSILGAPDNRVRAFLGPGHVCAVTGLDEYRPIAERFGVPIVVTGFEPLDLVEGILRTVRLLEASDPRVENQYGRSVREHGNTDARRWLDEVFEVTDRKWRGIGAIADSGYRVRDAYREQDAEHRFDVAAIEPREPPDCLSGQILRGVKKPSHCPLFGTRCTPETPLGATMVSSEGACAAYYASGRHLVRLGTRRDERRADP